MPLDLTKLQPLNLSGEAIRRIENAPQKTRLVKALTRLASGQSISDDDVTLLFSYRLAGIVATSYETAFRSENTATKAFRAARAWREASRPRDALRVIADIHDDWITDPERGIILTVMAAAMTDLLELNVARALAQAAVEANRLWSDYPQRVLARIARAEDRPLESQARMAQADHIHAYRRRAFSSHVEAPPGPATDATEFRSYRFDSESRKRRGRRRYSTYLASEAWQTRRQFVLERAAHQCEKCGSRAKLHVHHLHYMRIFREEPEDLEVLCDGCHTKEHDSEARALARVVNFLTGEVIAGATRCE